MGYNHFFFFFQAEDGIRDATVTGVQTCALPILQDDTALREQLLEAQMRLEIGEISDEEFAEIERDVRTRIREIKGQQQGAISMSSRDSVSEVEIEKWKPHSRGSWKLEVRTRN